MRIDSGEELAREWETFQSTRSLTSRNRLMLHYAPMVRYTAWKVAAGLPNMVEVDDLVAYGQFGLIDALNSYDPERGVKFETYASPRVRGSIIDELRKIDTVPRDVRAKIREIERMRTELQFSLGYEPSDREIAERLGFEVEEIWRLQGIANSWLMLNLDDSPNSSSDGDESFSFKDLTHDPSSNPEDIVLAGTEVACLLAASISKMPEKYRTILSLYYIHEMTLSEIGNVLGVTSSRVSQLQSRILQALRDVLAGRDEIAA